MPTEVDRVLRPDLRTCKLGCAAALAAVLAGCSAPAPRPQVEAVGGLLGGTAKGSDSEVSWTRANELGDAFIGREVVFRALWHEYADVDPDPDLSNPCPFTHVTNRVGGMVVKVPRGMAERNQLVVAARPGDTATITGLTFARSSVLISARKANGAPVFVTVAMPRRRTILFTKQGDCTERRKTSDEILTAAWLDNVLSQSVVEFLAPSMPQVSMPKAEEGLVLQAPGGTGAPVAAAAPNVTLLAALAEPARVRRGDKVRLTMTYSIGAADGQSVQVDESYLLSFDGEPLPRFPIRRSEPRAAGEHSGVYSQQIPAAASPGTYEFKAEVCVGGACSSRAAAFELAP